MRCGRFSETLPLGFRGSFIVPICSICFYRSSNAVCKSYSTRRNGTFNTCWMLKSVFRGVGFLAYGALQKVCCPTSHSSGTALIVRPLNSCVGRGTYRQMLLEPKVLPPVKRRGVFVLGCALMAAALLLMFGRAHWETHLLSWAAQLHIPFSLKYVLHACIPWLPLATLFVGGYLTLYARGTSIWDQA